MICHITVAIKYNLYKICAFIPWLTEIRLTAASILSYIARSIAYGRSYSFPYLSMFCSKEGCCIFCSKLNFCLAARASTFVIYFPHGEYFRYLVDFDLFSGLRVGSYNAKNSFKFASKQIIICPPNKLNDEERPGFDETLFVLSA